MLVIFSSKNAEQGHKLELVSRKADQIQKQCSLSSVASMAIEGDRKTIGLAPNKGLLIHERNLNWLLLQ